MEKWKLIPEFPHYAVSNTGRIQNLITGRLTASYPNHRGYYHTTIQLGEKRVVRPVHRLVAAAFIPGYSPELNVGHKNEDKSDNWVDNLVLRTRGESTMRATRRRVRVVETGIVYHSSAACARALGTSTSNVGKVMTGKNQTCVGFHLEWAD